MEQQDSSNLQLSKKDEKRVEDIFLQFSKAEPNRMQFYEFLMFCLDRQIVGPKISLSNLYDTFQDCIDDDEYKGKERSLTRSQFNFLLVQLARAMFPHDKGKQHLERLFNEVILVEKTVATKEAQIETTRTPTYDDTTKKILTELSFQVLCQYQEEMKAIFVSYMSENYNSDHLLLNWRELALEGKKMTSFAFIRFLNEAQIIPNHMSIEVIQEIQQKMVPPVISKEADFYSRHKMVQIMEKDLNGYENKYEGDPKLHFHEFQLALARIAYEERKTKSDEKLEMDKILLYFFDQVLGIRTNLQIENQPFLQINKKIYKRLNKYYHDIQEEQKEQQYNLDNESEEDKKDPIQMLAELQKQQIFEGESIQFDIQDIYNILMKDLPAIPEQVKIEQENPPPYKMEDPKAKKKVQIKVNIGDPVPEEPAEKGGNKQQKGAKAKAQLKKGEQEPRKIIFAGYPPPDPKLGYDYLEELQTQLTYGEKLLSDIKRGALTEVEVLPLIIDEILYPPECPQQIRYLIESAINCYNQQNYILALKHFDEAKIQWGKLDEPPVTDQVLLFFDYSKASIYQSAGRDDYALYFFMQCKQLSDKLPYTNPDRSLAYSGLGSVLFSTEEFEMSMRAFLRAREIREKLYGIEHVDSACCFNNLGCCMYMMERNQEAVAYFKLAQAIFECELGPFHTRSMTAASNIKKAEKGYFKNIPEFKTLWETYEEDAFKKKKKGKGGKKGKKK